METDQVLSEVETQSVYITWMHLRQTDSCHGADDKTKTAHHGGMGSIPAQFMWGLWSTKWHWDRFFSEYYGFPLPVPFHQGCTVIIIYMLPLPDVQLGEAWYPFKKQCSFGNWIEMYFHFLSDIKGLSYRSGNFYCLPHLTYMLLNTCLLTYLLVPWSKVLEKLTGSQLVKKFPRFYGTRKFITPFTSAHHLFLS